jgi:hypothetical protein
MMPPGHLKTHIGMLAASRATDKASCLGPPDFIVTGAATVTIGGKMAARILDKSMHGGVIMLGCFTVLIGGPTAGATLGNPGAGAAACQAAATGRTSGSTGQSWGNCGVETSRQMINQANSSNLQEQPFLQQQLNNGNANPGPGTPGNPASWTNGTGGTVPNQQVATLNANGVPASTVAPTMDNMEQSVAEGRGTAVSVWAGTLWQPQTGLAPGTGGHQVMVTGLEYDANGNLTTVIANDTGRNPGWPGGNCSVRYPAATFQGSLIGGGNRHVVTNNPIW